MRLNRISFFIVAIGLLKCVELNEKKSAALSFVFMDGTSSADVATAIHTHTDGSHTLVGYSEGSLNGQTNSGGQDAVLMQLSASGSVSYTKLLGTTSNDKANALAIDSSGNIYMAGFTSGNLAGETNQGGQDGFIAKFDSSGNQQWVKLIGANGTDEANAILVRSSTSILVAGTTSTSLNSQTSKGLTDVFLVEFDNSGNLISTTLLGSSADDEVSGLLSDTSGNLYVTGHSKGTVSASSTQNQGSTDFFVQKLNTNFELLWSRMHGNSLAQTSAVPCLNGEYLYLPGTTSGTLGLQSYGSTDFVLIQYDLNGNRLKTLQYGNASTDQAVQAICNADQSVYLYGKTTGDLGSGFGKGLLDIALITYDSAGVRGNTTVYGSSGNDNLSGVSSNYTLIGSTTGKFDVYVNQGNEDIFAIR